jgi:hypothetical protein
LLKKRRKIALQPLQFKSLIVVKLNFPKQKVLKLLKKNLVQLKRKLASTSRCRQRSLKRRGRDPNLLLVLNQQSKGLRNKNQVKLNKKRVKMKK